MPTRRDTFWQTLLGPLSRRQRRALRHGSHSSARRRPAGVSLETLESRIALAADAYPYVVSMNAAVTLTVATEMKWTAVFSEPVTGVDPADFQITGTDSLVFNNPLTLSAAAGGTTYTITATGITGTGKGTLKLVDDGSIRDASNHPLVAKTFPVSFAQASSISQGMKSPYVQRVGDFNADGYADVGIQGEEFGSQAKYTFVASGSASGLGSPVKRTDLIQGNGNGLWTDGIYPGDPDFNTDGIPDRISRMAHFDASGNIVQDGLGFFAQRADGTWANGILITGTVGFEVTGEPSPTRPRYLDVNNDGKLDLLVMDGTNNVAVVYGNGDGTFAAPTTIGQTDSWGVRAVGDFNGDARVDVLLATNWTGWIYFCNADGTFSSPISFGGIDAHPFRTGDFNLDGKLDLIGKASALGYGAFLGKGDGTFTFKAFPTGTTTQVSPTLGLAKPADVNGDGILDILANRAANAFGLYEVFVLTGVGDGTFKSAVTIRKGSWTNPPLAGDFNADGRMDLVTSDYDMFGNVYVSYGSASGTFTGAVVTRTAPPGIPGDLLATAGNASVALSWTAPTSTSPITDYLVQSSKDGGVTWTTFAHTKSTATNLTVTGLTNGATYVFHVAAVTAAGSGDFTDPSAAVKPIGPPAAVAKPTGTAGDASVTVKWTAPTSDGGSAITGYWVRWSNDNGVSWPAGNRVLCPATPLSITVPGLTNDIPWVFGVAAANDAGIGAYSPNSAAVTPLARPSTPANLTATRGNTNVALSWNASSPGSKTLTDYSVQSSKDGGVTWTSFAHTASTATTITVTGLTNGTAYLFRVAGVSAAGTGVYTTPVGPVTPATLPGVPTTITGVLDGPGQVTLTWKAPISTGGSAITDYRVQSSTDAGVTWSDFAHDPAVISTPVAGSKRISVTGLAVATPVIFRVAAINGVGTGANSLNSASFTPIDVPGAPSNLVPAVVTGDATIKLTWTAPTANGGGALKQYRIETSTDGGASVSSTVLTPSATSSTITISGFTPGTFYNFRVAAVNAAGVGAFTPYSAAVKAVARPGVPTDLAAVAGNASASLTWTAPASDGSSPITTYAVQSSKDGGVTWATFAHAASTLTSINVTGLINGTSYVFRVAAVNAMGTGTYTAASAAVVPMTVPGAPTALVATKGNTQVSLSWTAPTVTGGSAISDYSVQFSTDNGVSWTTFIHDPSTTTAIVVTGLTNGKSYVFRVAAVNAKGIGTYTAKTAAVIPSV